MIDVTIEQIDPETAKRYLAAAKQAVSRMLVTDTDLAEMADLRMSEVDALGLCRLCAVFGATDEATIQAFIPQNNRVMPVCPSHLVLTLRAYRYVRMNT